MNTLLASYRKGFFKTDLWSDAPWVETYLNKRLLSTSFRPFIRGIACSIRLDGPAGSQPFEKVAKHGKKGSINTL
jgi:hypothetical protein